MSNTLQPMDCSRPGSSAHGISQARALEWVAIPFSRGSSQPRDQTRSSCIGRWIFYHWPTWEALKFSCNSINKDDEDKDGRNDINHNS